MIKESQKMLAIHQNEQTQKRIAFFLASGIANIGYQYDEKGDILYALDYYHQGLTLYEQIDNLEGQSTCLNNLAVVYNMIGDTAKSLEYHLKSLDLKKRINDKEGIALSYNNIGTIYEARGENFIALEYYEKSLKISDGIDDPRGIAMTYDNIGDIYFREDVLGKALKYYQLGYDSWSMIGNETGMSTSLNNLANVHIRMGKLDIAKKYAIESYELADKVGYPVDIENAAKTLMVIYRNENNFKEAYKYAAVYITAREETKTSQNSKEALKKSLEYEYHKIALQDSLEFQKEQEVKDIQIQEKETQATALYAGVGLLLIVLLIGIRSYQQKRKDNRLINTQKQEVEAQKQEIEKQHIALETTHKEISDSISYAKRIQEAILPSQESLNKHLKNGFVFYRPKDVVSGDFYWLVEFDNKVLIAAADCTGHGVPGAMVSVVCHNALNRVVRELKISQPAEILNKTREIIIETFSARSENVRDGMDISLCCWDPDSLILEWAGAYNPLFLLRRSDTSEMEVILADRQPVSKHEKTDPFTNHSLQLEKGDRYYLFTDGFVDQFGGDKGKKYKHSQFKDLLVQTARDNMDEQGKLIEEEFDQWKGSFEQLDDVCVIGILV